MSADFPADVIPRAHLLDVCRQVHALDACHRLPAGQADAGLDRFMLERLGERLAALPAVADLVGDALAEVRSAHDRPQWLAPTADLGPDLGALVLAAVHLEAAVNAVPARPLSELLLFGEPNRWHPADDGAPAYSVIRSGDNWIIRYGMECGEYVAARNKAIGWLVILLRRPNRLLTVAELSGDADGRLAADAAIGAPPKTSIAQIVAIKNRIAEIDDLDEMGRSETYQSEKAGLLRRLQEGGAERLVQAPLRKGHHRIATRLRAFRNKLAETGMPSLSAHLTTCLDLDFPHFSYRPPPDAPAWRI